MKNVKEKKIKNKFLYSFCFLNHHFFVYLVGERNAAAHISHGGKVP